MGVIGFDLGGTVALLVAASRTLGAAVTVGGTGTTEPLSDSFPSLVSAAAEVTCPWLGIYGEPADGSKNPELERLKAAADGTGVATILVTYPESGHRFDEEPVAAEDAWQRMLNWFDSHLR
jgi:carboxymethylenebutenolidase